MFHPLQEHPPLFFLLKVVMPHLLQLHLLYPTEQIRPPGSAPPVGAAQALIEDFGSLSLGSVPGSFDSGLDSQALPRPLDGDVEPRCYAEMYPMNCDSRYLRLTTSGIPNSQSLVSRWHLPLGAVVCPLAEAPNREEVPIVNFAPMGIIRCRRCGTYVNPYVTFTDGGRKWQCNICVLLNEVPGDYFAPLDASARRIDLDQWPELIKGSVEFVAQPEYMVQPPMPPLYFFLIDVSISAVRSGMLEVVAQTIKSCLDKLPGSPRTQIVFITYDSTIHFYNMKSSLTQPQMMVVSDLDDIKARNLLGEDFPTEYSRVSFYEHENDESRKLMWILQKFREADPSYYQLCHLVRQGEQPREGFFIPVNLVEDHVGGMNGYLDWILQIHR